MDLGAVGGAAAIALGSTRAPSARKVLVSQLGRPSRYLDVIRHSVLVGLAELTDDFLAPVFARDVDGEFNPLVREAAITRCARAAPHDAALRQALRKLATNPDPTIHAIVLGKIGAFHHAGDLEFLRELANIGLCYSRIISAIRIQSAVPALCSKCSAPF